MRASTIHALLSLPALALGGCGLFAAEGTLEATVPLEAQVEIDRVGSLTVIEQSAGAGFVMEGGVSLPGGAAAALDGFAAIDVSVAGGGTAGGVSAGATTTVEASGGGGATLVSADYASGDASGGGVGRGTGGIAGGTNGASGGFAGGVDGAGGGVSGGGVSGGGVSGASGGVSGGASGGSVPAGSVPGGAGGNAVGANGAGGGAYGGGAGGAGTSGGVSGGAGGGLAAGGAAGSAAGIDVGLHLEARATVPRDGVWSVDGRPTVLSALTGPGVQVDGVQVSLAELAALGDLELPSAPDAALPTDGALSVWAEVEHGTLPAAGGETRVVVRARANPGQAPRRARLRVHLVIDRSSSMQRSWARVLDSARSLVARLAPTDELQIVVYGSDATEALPLGPVGDGAQARAALGRVSVGGGTNIEAGLDLAYRASARARAGARGLVVLLSDGVPNHGAFEASELSAMASRAAQAGSCSTSVIGLGAEFDGRLLRQIARGGGGGYHVTAGVEGLAHSLHAELEAHAFAAAHDVRLRVHLEPGVELIETSGAQALGSDRGAGVELALPFLDAGEERQIVLRVRVPARARGGAIARAVVRYRPAGLVTPLHAERPLEVSVGPRAVAASAGATGALLDHHLGASLDAAATAIARGDGAAAAEAMRAHATLAEGRVELARAPRLAARARVARRLGAALEALVPGSSHPHRRQVSVAFGALAARFGR